MSLGLNISMIDASARSSWRKLGHGPLQVLLVPIAESRVRFVRPAASSIEHTGRISADETEGGKIEGPSSARRHRHGRPSGIRGPARFVLCAAAAGPAPAYSSKMRAGVIVEGRPQCRRLGAAASGGRRTEPRGQARLDGQVPGRLRPSWRTKLGPRKVGFDVSSECECRAPRPADDATPTTTAPIGILMSYGKPGELIVVVATRQRHGRSLVSFHGLRVRRRLSRGL
ncbi:MAG: hypothetical protein MZV64_22805 [Ignavibacteriales bacterium]|nr:hypothetical protein [Ignavibacteriales bacterium]